MLFKSFNAIQAVPPGESKFWLFLEEEHTRLSKKYLYSQINRPTTYQVLWFAGEKPSLSFDYKTGLVSPHEKTLDGHHPSGLFYFHAYKEFLKVREQLERGDFCLTPRIKKLRGIPLGRPLLGLPWGPFRPALFLDRDGVINIDGGYIFEYANIKYKDDIFILLKKAQQLGYDLFVLTNQSGIGRGYYSAKQVEKLHIQMDADFKKEDIIIKAWVYSPYHDLGQGAYCGVSLTRKPGPGMIHQLQCRYPIDLQKSIMIGDKLSDALLLPGPSYCHLQGQYDLTGAKGPIFQSIKELVREKFYEA